MTNESKLQMIASLEGLQKANNLLNEFDMAFDSIIDECISDVESHDCITANGYALLTLMQCNVELLHTVVSLIESRCADCRTIADSADLPFF